MKRSLKSFKSQLKKEQQIIRDYVDPSKPGSLGGVARFAKAHRLDVEKTKRALEKELSYTLHKPRRKRFATTPVMVFGMDEQWVADLIDVRNIRKENNGYRYLLTVIDV